MKNIVTRYREYRGEKLRLRAEVVWLLDELLDQIPRVEITAHRRGGVTGRAPRVEARWFRYGQWGCALGLQRYWGRDEFRKEEPGADPAREQGTLPR